MPRASEEVVSVAWPSPSTDPVPNVADASLNVTVPVGVPPPPTAFTVAVNVTGCPTSTGFAEEVKVVQVGDAAWAAAAPKVAMRKAARDRIEGIASHI